MHKINLTATACLALLLGALLTACGSSDNASDVETPTVEVTGLTQKAESVMAPGQSGFVSAPGQLQGTLTGQPADYGEHLDDQRLLFWSFGAKPATLGAKPGTPERPSEGVEIYRDAYGVPIVHASSTRGLWKGVGYAIARDRLFEMDAIRRMAAGTLAELAGCGAVPGDIQQRVLGYTDVELTQMRAALSPDTQEAIAGYVEGANLWRAQVLADPRLLPAEYALLSSLPDAFTEFDILRASILTVRFVADEGAFDFFNVPVLKALAGIYGDTDEAITRFLDLIWLDDPKAVTSVPVELGRFSNQPEPLQGRDAVFAELARWAITLPDTLRLGEGTGHAPRPAGCTLPALPGLGGSAQPMLQARAPNAVRKPATPLAAVQQKIALGLQTLRQDLRGGSLAIAIGKTRARDGGALFIGGPQLGWSYPPLIVELELQGPGEIARGISVPLLPVMGPSYTPFLAATSTVSYSKNVDSVIETVCTAAQQSAGECRANQYRHKGQWKDMVCRPETIRYRADTSGLPGAPGLPAGPAMLTLTHNVCRTVHGPVIARDATAGLARTYQSGMWFRELDTLDGGRALTRARSFDEIVQALKKMTWHENVTVATREGDVAYFHPGLYLRRPPHTDQRLPVPGQGDHDFGVQGIDFSRYENRPGAADYIPFDDLPRAVNPPQGFVVNWNNKPAAGWLDGEGLGYSSRPAGAGQRVTSMMDLVSADREWTFAKLAALDRELGVRDARAREYLPVLAGFAQRAATQLDDTQRAALNLVLDDWDRRHYDLSMDIEDAQGRDSPGATVFGELVDALREELFGNLRAGLLNPANGYNLFLRLAEVGNLHPYDHAVIDNLVLRFLNPASSGLSFKRDFAQGRTPDQVMLAAVNRALARIAQQYNAGAPLTPVDLQKARRVHARSPLCSISGAVGPGGFAGCVTMPHQDRGSYVFRVAWERP